MATNSMKKGEIVGHLATKIGTTKKVANQFLDELVNLSYREAKKDFTIPGLGKLTIVNRKKRVGRNPATGESMVIPAKKVLKFKVSKIAQNAVYPPQK